MGGLRAPIPESTGLGVNLLARNPLMCRNGLALSAGRFRLVLSLSCALLGACAREGNQTYSLQDFGKLRWLEGSWRGEVPTGGYFYEQYRAVDDSTIAMRGFADSTFTQPNDSADIMLRGGRIIDRSTSSEYFATTLDSTRVEFTPAQPKNNHFSWVRESADRWTATLRPAQGKTIVYPMVRVRR
jgi:hypothetical protein